MLSRVLPRRFGPREGKPTFGEVAEAHRALDGSQQPPSARPPGTSRRRNIRAVSGPWNRARSLDLKNARAFGWNPFSECPTIRPVWISSVISPFARDRRKGEMG